MFFYVYYLHSKKFDKFYIGTTQNLQKRLKEHNNGSNFSTKAYSPWSIIYYEAHLNKDDAIRKEGYLKTTQGRQAIRRMLRNQLNSEANLSQQKVYY